MHLCQKAVFSNHLQMSRYKLLSLSSRAHSLCGDNSDRTLSSASHRNSFTGAGAMAR